MPLQVCMGAMMQCSFGMAPSSLVVLPTNKVMTNMVPDANIMDHIPMTNIMPFGMCQSLVKPDCSRGDGRGPGCPYADAMHPGDAGSLGHWGTHRAAGKLSLARQRLATDVYLGRGHYIH